MKTCFLFLLLTVSTAFCGNAQNAPCNDPRFRAFDFWIGNWDVYGKNQRLAGHSQISVLLDSCVILEEWTSENPQSHFVYKGKSFNTFNVITGQWQQTWVDNTGNTTAFLRSETRPGQIIFFADHVPVKDGQFIMRRLTFTKLSVDRVRQLGEKSDDLGKTWQTEYDLDYHRK